MLFPTIFLIQVFVFVANCQEIQDTNLNNYESKYAFKTSQVVDEFIVFYNGSYSRTIRHEILRNLVTSNDITEFQIQQKNKVFDSLPSDFDVLKVFSVNNRSLESFTKCPFVGRISQQVQVIRSLKSSQDENEENPVAEKDPEPLKLKSRQLFRAIPKQLVDQVHAKYLWIKGITGSGINVAIFDTGLEENHPHFKNVIERIDWTESNNAKDNLGHGTFVCGLVASSKECFGLAPDVNLYIFKVFTDSQVSYTSWFLDAFNYAIQKKIDVLNLSIGGPDFMDLPFISKVREITASGITMVSGIGNDGPLYGTLNNPGDQMDVIGVGGINSEDQIAKFSSRGMTTWELPAGYGRVKPDIVTYCTHVRGSRQGGGCRTLSGTSVASPIITGAIALLLSAFKKLDFGYEPNPGIIKQLVMASADRLDNSNMFEQGHGKLNVARAYKMMRQYRPQASSIPSYIDLTECPYFWPYCSQPIYHSGMPTIVNVTILNGLSVTGYIRTRPRWKPSLEANGNLLKMEFSYSTKLWPWSGYLAVKISVSSEAKDFYGTAEGMIQVEVEDAPTDRFQAPLTFELNIYVKARIVPTPARKQRLLWDQFHNLRYPSGYFPRDNLKIKNDPLDWNADHPHTNFKSMYQYLRNAGYFVEILGHNHNCFNSLNYGALLIVDSEEEFHKTEIDKIYSDVTSKGLSLVIFADWYNGTVIKNAKFFDENTRKWWTPVTGGSNLPALNDLLNPYGISFGDKVYEGFVKIGEHSTEFASGTRITRFPKSAENYLVYAKLRDQGYEFIMDAMKEKVIEPKEETVPVLGLYQSMYKADSGRIALFGDSNCLDSSHNKNDCFWLLSAMLEYALHKNLYSPLKERTSEDFEFDSTSPDPVRVYEDSFNKHSKFGSQKLKSRFLKCEKTVFEREIPIRSISAEFYPTDKNNFNFLQLQGGLEEEGEEMLLLKTNDIESDLNAGPANKISNEEGKGVLSIPSDWPVLPSLALLLVLTFFLSKLWKHRRLVRIRLFNLIRRINRAD